MNRILNTITHIGIDETVDPSEIKYITLLNILVLVAIFCNFGFLPLLFKYLPESEPFLYLCISSFPFLLVVILFNHFKYHLIAKIYFNLIGIFFYVTIAILGAREMSYHLILVILAAFFIYPPDKKHLMHAIILTTMGSFIGLEVWFLNHEVLFSLSREFQKSTSFTMNMIFITYVLGFAFYIYTIYLRAEKKSESLLNNILPVKIANRLKLKPESIADRFEECSVLFADIVNFTKFSEKVSPEKLVTTLNEIFSRFDDLVDKYGVEKIKTIGDAYMVVAGLPQPVADHAGIIAELAHDMKNVIKDFQDNEGNSLQLRIGIGSGPVVAGIIGKKKFIYDLWGDTVNTASRMESHGLPDEIQVTQSTYELLKDRYIFTERGKVDIKGKGQIQTYFLAARHAVPTIS